MMPKSLGEKLRTARQDRDISISEVAEQTRISALYLEAIENDDYKTLPGGIFNKGFIKSFARYVGVDENEAMRDYAELVLSKEESAPDHLKLYKPRVMIDDASRSSLITTVIFAAIVLGLLAWGVVFLLHYFQNGTAASGKQSGTGGAPTAAKPAGKAAPERKLSEIRDIRLEITTTADRLSISSTVDGRAGSAVIQPDKGFQIEAKQSVRISYYKGLADTVGLVLNGRKIKTPLPSEDYKKNAFEFEINLGNVRQILRSGVVDTESAGAG